MGKKIICMLITLLSVCILSGCNETLRSFCGTDLPSQVESRIEANIACVDKLYNAGLITEDKSNKLKDNIEANGEYVKNEFKRLSSSENAQSDILKSITSLFQFYDDDSGFVAYAKVSNEMKEDEEPPAAVNGKHTMDLANQVMLSNYLISNKGIKAGVNGWNYSDISEQWLIRRSNPEKAIEIVPVDIVSIDNESLSINSNYKVCVLDASKIDKTGDTGKNIDNLKEIFNKYVDNSGVLSEQATGELSRFYKETDENLFDSFDSSNLISTTKEIQSEEDRGKLGYDMTITQSNMNSLTIRLNEFNEKAVDDLIYMVSCKSGKYILCPKTGMAYLVEYPVQVIDEISTDGNNINATVTDSELGINIKSGDIIRYQKVDGQEMPNRTVIGNEIAGYESYLTTYGSDNEKGESCSSFALFCEQNVKIESGYNGQNISEITSSRSVETVGVVLRDYLEATYAPGLVGKNENMVLFGRKFRLAINGTDGDKLKLSGTGIGYLVDSAGDTVLGEDGNAIKINYDQLMDLSTAITNGNVGDSTYAIYRLRKSGESNNDEIQAQASTIGSNPKTSELKIVANDSIKPVTKFPGDNIGTSDNPGKSNQPILYAIGTCTDMFESGLYSSWITSSSPTQSLTWWNQWLKNTGFSYSIELQKLEEYLSGEYSYELSQAGLLVLDLDTIAMIQSDIDEINNKRNNDTRRAIFKLLGLVLIVYSIILMVCWTIDTQLGIGLDLYKIVSFGKWQAIKYKDDIPIGCKEKNYVALGRMIVNTVVIMAIGTVVIRLNIVQFIYVIVNNFGKFAEYISDLL